MGSVGFEYAFDGLLLFLIFCYRAIYTFGIISKGKIIVKSFIIKFNYFTF